MTWLSVNGWALLGSSELGTNRSLPSPSNIAEIAKSIETHKIGALVILGGYTGYQGKFQLNKFKEKYTFTFIFTAYYFFESVRYPALDIPIICVPGTIANNCPATENSIGADTALNNILDVCPSPSFRFFCSILIGCR